jgi:TolB-like protein/cytochrome c-type biogenesis protein CcmH/NrfG
MGLLSELRRRNVFRMAVLYVVAAWLIMQVAEVVIGLADLPEWIGPTILGMLAIGFPIALLFSWFYELTPEGISLEEDIPATESITHITGRRMDFIVISLLCAGLILFAYDKWWIGPPPEKSIAVLPFENLSADPEQEYFSDGVSEELLNLLAQIPELTVISRSSAFSFKGKDVAIPTVAEQLNVAHILEGSVRKVGNRVRITAQLIEARSDSYLWSESYDRELDDIFGVQSEIASAVVDALKITLLGNKPKATETNSEAYALYLQGRYFTNQGTEESFKQAETLLKQALSIDSSFAPVWTELASVYTYQAGHNFRPHDEGFELARNAAQQALVIDPGNARGYASLARVERQHDWNFVAAYQHTRRALMLDPTDAYVLRDAADLYTRLGRFDEAIDLYRQSIALDPVSSRQHLDLGRVLYYAGRLDEAVVSLRKALSLTPGVIRGNYFLGWVLLAQGDAHGALVAMKQETGNYYRLTGTTVIQHALHNAEASNAALKELIENRTVESSYQIALAYAYRGEIDASFEWLQLAYDTRDSGLNKMLVDPMLANLHSDPRWKTFLDKIGFPH